jgi:hypothetical protein
MTDYRDQAIAAGVYGLRYGQQPADGDHLGTSDSRDFLVLTSFEHDQDVAPVAKIDELVARSKPISPSEHAIVLYLAEAPPADATHGGSAPAAPAASSPAPAKDGAPPAGDANAGAAHDPLPRFFQRGSKDEWALELLLHGRPEGGKEPEPLRAAVVLVGHTAG